MCELEREGKKEKVCQSEWDIKRKNKKKRREPEKETSQEISARDRVGGWVREREIERERERAFINKFITHLREWQNK